jgi:hypothetical protein
MVGSLEGSCREAERNTPWRGSTLPPALCLAFALMACGGGSEIPGQERDTLVASEEIARALEGGDDHTFAARVHSTLPLRIELRQTLVETDERSATTLTGPAEARRWLDTQRQLWRCRGDDCRWPGGLVTEGEEHCFGDCCDLRPPGGMELGTLYLRRICLAHRERGEPRLSLLAFYEAR